MWWKFFHFMLSMWTYEKILSKPNSPWEEKQFSSIFQGDSFQCSPFLKQGVGIKHIGNHFKQGTILKGEVSLYCRPFRQWHARQACGFYSSLPAFKFGGVNSLSAVRPLSLISAASSSWLGYTVSDTGLIRLTSRIGKARERGRNEGSCPDHRA